MIIYRLGAEELLEAVRAGNGASIKSAWLFIDFKAIEMARLEEIGNALLGCPNLEQIKLNTQNLSGPDAYDDTIAKKLSMLVEVLNKCSILNQRSSLWHMEDISALRDSFPEQFVYLNAINSIGTYHSNSEPDQEELKVRGEMEDMDALRVGYARDLLCLIATGCGAKVQEIRLELSHREIADPLRDTTLYLGMMPLMGRLIERHQNWKQLSTEGFKHLVATCAYYLGPLTGRLLSTHHFTTMGCHLPGATIQDASRIGFEILGSVFSHLPNLKKISLGVYDRAAPFIGEELQLLQSAMSGCQSLQEIVFDTGACRNIYLETIKDVKILGEILVNAPSLQVLEANLMQLIFIYADDEEQKARADIFGDYLSRCEALHTIKIDVKWNYSFKYFFSMLSRCPNWTKIELRYDQEPVFFSRELDFFDVLVEELQRCRKLRDIKVVGKIDLSDEQLRILGAIGEENKRYYQSSARETVTQELTALSVEPGLLREIFEFADLKPDALSVRNADFAAEVHVQTEQRREDMHQIMLADSKVNRVGYIDAKAKRALNVAKAEATLAARLVQAHALACGTALRGHNAAVAAMLLPAAAQQPAEAKVSAEVEALADQQLEIARVRAEAEAAADQQLAAARLALLRQQPQPAQPPSQSDAPRVFFQCQVPRQAPEQAAPVQGSPVQLPAAVPLQQQPVPLQNAAVARRFSFTRFTQRGQ